MWIPELYHKTTESEVKGWGPGNLHFKWSSLGDSQAFRSLRIIALMISSAELGSKPCYFQKRGFSERSGLLRFKQPILAWVSWLHNWQKRRMEEGKHPKTSKSWRGNPRAEHQRDGWPPKSSVGHRDIESHFRVFPEESHWEQSFEEDKTELALI